MKKINDNTVVKVRVPKHLYEAVKARMAKVEEMKHTKEEGYTHGGKKEEGMHKMQDESAINEMDLPSLMSAAKDIVQNLDSDTITMILTAAGLTGIGKKLSDMIKKEKANIGGITGAYTSFDDEK